MRTNLARWLTVAAAFMVLGSPLVGTLVQAELNPATQTLPGFAIYLDKGSFTPTSGSGKIVMDAPTSADSQQVVKNGAVGVSTSTTWTRSNGLPVEITPEGTPKAKIFLSIAANAVPLGNPSEANAAVCPKPPQKFIATVTLKLGALTSSIACVDLGATAGAKTIETELPFEALPETVNSTTSISVQVIVYAFLPQQALVTYFLNSTAHPSQVFIPGTAAGAAPVDDSDGNETSNETSNETGNDTGDDTSDLDNQTADDNETGEPGLDVEGNATANATGGKKAKDEGLLPGFGLPALSLGALAAVAYLRRRRRGA